MKDNLARDWAIPIAVAAMSLVSVPASGDTVEVNGIEMYYETVGQGQPLLLLHGFTQVGAEWNPIRDEFESEWKLIIPDLRGHGSSTNPSGDFANRQVALDLFALLNHLGVGRFQAIGYSTGGDVLLHMATQEPERIEAMLLIATAHYRTAQARETDRNFVNGMPDDFMEELRTVHKHGEQQIEALLEIVEGFADDYDDQNFTPANLSTITARTLIMLGDRDRFHPVSIAAEMYEAIPQSYLWIVPNMNHLAMWGPIQGHFVCTAKAFLRDQWNDSPARLCE